MSKATENLNGLRLDESLPVTDAVQQLIALTGDDEKGVFGKIPQLEGFPGCVTLTRQALLADQAFLGVTGEGEQGFNLQLSLKPVPRRNGQVIPYEVRKPLPKDQRVRK